MTDKHVHCVYFRYNNPNSLEGYCLLKQEKITHGYRSHCKDMVLRPLDVLEYYIMNETECDGWGEAVLMAEAFMRKSKFNNYPTRRRE